MEINLQDQYEKILLLVFGLVALVVSGLLVFKSMGSEVDSNSSGGSGGKAQKEKTAKPQMVSSAIELLNTETVWETPTKKEQSGSGGGKPHPFAASNPILKKGEANFDMQNRDPSLPKLWPPVDNWWWYQYEDLDPTSATCLLDDPDQDGFTNEAEFLNKTDPTDETSKPDWPTAVELVERVELEYEFRVNYINPEVQFSRILPTRRVWFLKPGTKDDTTGDGRFRVTDVIPAGPDSIKQPAQIVIQDNARDDGNPLKVAAIRQTTVRPEYQALLRFNISGDEVTAKKGQPFTFPGLEYELTVTKITEIFVEITYTDDKGRKQKFEAKKTNN